MRPAFCYSGRAPAHSRSLAKVHIHPKYCIERKSAACYQPCFFSACYGIRVELPSPQVAWQPIIICKFKKLHSD